MSKTIAASAAMASEEPVPGPAEGSEGRAVPMRSEDARAGKRVKVREDHRTPSLRGREGTIVKSWGNPGYAALDVLLDEGHWQLFWYYELEEIDERP